MRSLACLLILVAVVAANPITDRGKAAIDRAFEDFHQKLRTALKGANGSVLVVPLRKLRELKAAGRGDQEHIAAFGTGEHVENQLSSSVAFWTDKMAEVIEPYVTHPERYRNLIIDFFPVPSDPTWNNTQAYREIETEINGMVEKAMHEMKRTFMKQMEKIKAKEVKDATASSWARLQLDRLMEDTEKSMNTTRQYAKRDAANGNSAAVERVKNNIRDRKSQFNKEVHNIISEYQEATDN